MLTEALRRISSLSHHLAPIVRSTRSAIFFGWCHSGQAISSCILQGLGTKDIVSFINAAWWLLTQFIDKWSNYYRQGTYLSSKPQVRSTMRTMENRCNCLAYLRCLKKHIEKVKLCSKSPFISWPKVPRNKSAAGKVLYGSVLAGCTEQEAVSMSRVSARTVWYF